MSTKAFLITDRRAGLGDALLNLHATWFLAKKLNRDVIIDWRRLPYTLTSMENWTRHHVNLFSALFEKPASLEGVNFFFPEEFSEIFFGPKTEDGYPFDLDHLKCLDDGHTEDQFLRVITRTGESYTDFFQKLSPELRQTNKNNQPCLFSEFFQDDRPNISSFFNHLKLVPLLASAYKQFAKKEFSDMPVAGIHFRHGNGEMSIRGSNWIPLKEAIEVIKNTVKTLGECRKFICTDSPVAFDMLRESFPNSFYYTRPPGAENDGGIHFNTSLSPISTIQEALLDMWLLKHCDHYVVTSRSTFTVPAILKQPSNSIHELFKIKNK